MQTNRLIFTDLNESAYISGGQTSIIGFTTVKAPRGLTIPYKFPKGAEQQIKAMIGSPSKDYPDIQEAIEFNRNYSLYISAPPGVKTALSNYYGGIYVTTEASFESFYEVTDPENPNFEIEVTAASTQSPFSEESIKGYTATTNPELYVDNIPNEFFATGAVSQISISYPTGLSSPTGTTTTITLDVVGTNIVTQDETPIDVGDIVVGSATTKIVIVGNAAVSGLDLTDGGELDLYLSSGLTNVTITWVLNIENFVIQTFYQNSPRSSTTTFSFKNVDLDETVDTLDNPYYNTISFSFTEEVNGVTEYSSSTIYCSPNIDAVDGQNASLYYEDRLAGKVLWYIGSKVYQNYFDTTGTWNFTAPISKEISGVRIVEDDTFSDSTDLATTLGLGWTEANSPEYSEVHIFFDNSGEGAIKTTMSSLRLGTHKMATFVSPILASTTDTSTAVTNIGATRSSSPNVQGGLTYTCNEFLVKDPSGQEYYTPIIGTVAANLALIMDKKLGGAAPMFTNDGNGLGGQLNRSVKKQKYKFSADNLDTLDAAGVNPIILDSYYGLMLTSQKTAASASFLTDWSFLGHSMAFDLLKREIQQTVMIPQIGKAISQYYLELRQRQTDQILNTRLTGATAIWTDAIALINDTSVNNDETKSMNKFVVKVRIKVTPFSEWVELVLQNISQSATV